MIIASDRKAVMEFLKKEPLINLNIIELMENRPELEVLIDKEEDFTGVLIEKDYFSYTYFTDDVFLDKICERFSGDGYYGFAGVKEELAEKILSKFNKHWANVCDVFYLKEDKACVNLSDEYIDNLREQDAEIVDSFYEYSHEGSCDKILDDIKNRPSACIRIDDKILSWVLTHEDGSLGIMYTRNECRGKGYAEKLTRDICRKTTEKGKVPYVQILIDNEASLNLASKCGFEKLGRCVWFGVEVKPSNRVGEGVE